MADKTNFQFAGFLCDSHVRGPSNIGENLDEVHSAILQGDHSLSALGRVVHGYSLGIALATREKGSSKNHVRTKHLAPLDVLPTFLKQSWIAAHVTHAGDTVGDVKRIDDLFVPCWG